MKASELIKILEVHIDLFGDVDFICDKSNAPCFDKILLKAVYLPSGSYEKYINGGIE